MKAICILCCLALLGACATPHAARVSCDGKLRPINLSAPPASGAVAGASAAGTPEVAP